MTSTVIPTVTIKTTPLPTTFDYETTMAQSDSSDESSISSITTKQVPISNFTTEFYNTKVTTSSSSLDSFTTQSFTTDSFLPTVLSTEYVNENAMTEHSDDTNVTGVSGEDEKTTQYPKEISEVGGVTDIIYNTTLFSTLRTPTATKPPKRPCIPVEPTTKTTQSTSTTTGGHQPDTTTETDKKEVTIEIMDSKSSTEQTTITGMSTTEKIVTDLEIETTESKVDDHKTVEATDEKDHTGEDKTTSTEFKTTTESKETTTEYMSKEKPVTIEVTSHTGTTESTQISKATTTVEKTTSTPSEITESVGISTIKSTSVHTSTNMTTITSLFTTPTEETFTLTTVTNLTGSDCGKITCYNGGTCVITSEGPRCVCRFDWQDPYCKSPIRVKNAAFAGDSYLSHLIYSENHPDFDIQKIDAVLPIKVEFKARTRASEGLISLAIAQGSKGSHYTALFLHNGLLQFQFSCGLQTMLLSELEAPINTGHEFTVQMELDFSRNHSHCNASLRVNDTLAMSGDQPTWLGSKSLGKSKTIESIWLHLGGAPQTPIVLMAELPGAQGFSGCLHSLRINDEYKEIFR
jgi:hypothetical protein